MCVYWRKGGGEREEEREREREVGVNRGYMHMGVNLSIMNIIKGLSISL